MKNIPAKNPNRGGDRNPKWRVNGFNPRSARKVCNTGYCVSDTAAHLLVTLLKSFRTPPDVSCIMYVSSVSVYCKCLLRVSIVRVFCKCPLSFRSKTLRNQLFDCVSVHKCCKAMRFVVFSIKQHKRMLKTHVLLRARM